MGNFHSLKITFTSKNKILLLKSIKLSIYLGILLEIMVYFYYGYWLAISLISTPKHEIMSYALTVYDGNLESVIFYTLFMVR